MNSVFSVDDFSDTFWAAEAAAETATGMNPSQSYSSLQKFLEECSVSPRSMSCAGQNVIAPTSAAAAAAAAVAASQPSGSKVEEGHDDSDIAEVGKPNFENRDPYYRPPPSDPTATVPINSDEYQEVLRSKLSLACAFALSRASGVEFDDSSALANNKAHQSGSQAQGFPKAQGEPDPAASGISASTITPRSGTQVRLATSGSSREDSDDEDLDGDTETTDNMDPADAKRERRMKSNRESARRSRRRKQAHMTELEAQVGQLRVERSTLLKSLTDLNQKCDESAVGNRILKADIETLRARVKLAEETVKRVTGINPQLLSRPNVPNGGMPFINSPLEATAGAAIAMQPNANPFLHQPVPAIATTVHHQILDNSFPNNTIIPAIVNPQIDVGAKNTTGTTSTLEHVQDQLGLDIMQKQSSNGISQHGTLPGRES